MKKEAILRQAKTIENPSQVFALIRKHKAEEEERERESRASTISPGFASLQSRTAMRGTELSDWIDEGIRKQGFGPLPRRGIAWYGSTFAEHMISMGASLEDWKRAAALIKEDVLLKEFHCVHPQCLVHMLPVRLGLPAINTVERYPAPPGEMWKIFLPAIDVAITRSNEGKDSNSDDSTFQWAFTLAKEVRTTGMGKQTLAYVKKHYPDKVDEILERALVDGPQDKDSYRWLRSQGASISLGDIGALGQAAFQGDYLKDVLSEVPAELRRGAAQRIMDVAFSNFLYTFKKNIKDTQPPQ